MRVFICLIGLACVGMLSPELAAQAPPSQPATQAPPSRVPLVDELEADPQQRLVELTLALYQVVIEAQEQSCLELGGEVRSFLDLNEAEIEAQALALQQDLALLSEDALAERAQELALAFALPEVAQAQGVLWSCLRSAELQGERRLLEKQMRRFYRLQESLVLSITGNVD